MPWNSEKSKFTSCSSSVEAFSSFCGRTHRLWWNIHWIRYKFPKWIFVQFFNLMTGLLLHIFTIQHQYQSFRRICSFIFIEFSLCLKSNHFGYKKSPPENSGPVISLKRWIFTKISWFWCLLNRKNTSDREKQSNWKQLKGIFKLNVRKERKNFILVNITRKVI